MYISFFHTCAVVPFSGNERRVDVSCQSFRKRFHSVRPAQQHLWSHCNSTQTTRSQHIIYRQGTWMLLEAIALPPSGKLPNTFSAAWLIASFFLSPVAAICFKLLKNVTLPGSAHVVEYVHLCACAIQNSKRVGLT